MGVAATADVDLQAAEETGFEVLQRKSEHSLVVDARNAMDPNILYLDTCLSFHSMLTILQLDEIKKVTNTLRGRCNASITTSNEKATYVALLKMWLVCKNGIANLVSAIWLELDGFRLAYNSLAI